MRAAVSTLPNADSMRSVRHGMPRGFPAATAQALTDLGAWAPLGFAITYHESSPIDRGAWIGCTRPMSRSCDAIVMCLASSSATRAEPSVRAGAVDPGPWLNAVGDLP